jgi:sugar/nucleoside kinase (ribokinase family)
VKVVVYGSVNWDEIYQLPRYPNEHEKVRGTGFRGHLGGSAANTATWLAMYVADVAFVGAVGNDAEGGRCLDALERAGVHITSVEICHAVPTARASSWVAGNDKRISIFRDPRLWRDHATPLALEASTAADHIHLASHVDKAGIECLTAAIEGGASVSIELSGKPHDDVRPLADIVFLNAEELLEVFGVDVADLTTDRVGEIAPKEGWLSRPAPGRFTAPAANALRSSPCNRSTRSSTAPVAVTRLTPASWRPGWRGRATRAPWPRGRQPHVRH